MAAVAAAAVAVLGTGQAAAAAEAGTVGAAAVPVRTAGPVAVGEPQGEGSGQLASFVAAAVAGRQVVGAAAAVGAAQDVAEAEAAGGGGGLMAHVASTPAAVGDLAVRGLCAPQEKGLRVQGVLMQRWTTPQQPKVAQSEVQETPVHPDATKPCKHSHHEKEQSVWPRMLIN